jgi:chromosome transmission fidelity protein 1
MMEDVYDIEDVVKVGRETKICPYYGTRATIPMAELVTLSYNILLQKETRDSFSINLKNQIVIIDEAHNLLDTITQIHSVEISQCHITQSLNQLNGYVERYKARLSAKNLLYCKQLLNVLTGLNKCFYVKNDDKNSLSANNGKLVLSRLALQWSYRS